jgi:hypothetical protein
MLIVKVSRSWVSRGRGWKPEKKAVCGAGWHGVRKEDWTME